MDGIDKISPEVMAEVITGLADSFDAELFSKQQDELDDSYWFFRWDTEATDEWNTYQFYQMLELYDSFVKRWEEKYHGYVCIVERVRDKYLMPKIKEFVKQLKD